MINIYIFGKKKAFEICLYGFVRIFVPGFKKDK